MAAVCRKARSEVFLSALQGRKPKTEQLNTQIHTHRVF